MSVIRFPIKKIAKLKAVEEESSEERFERYVRWREWKDRVRHWGGGHRKQDGVSNPKALATFDIDQTKWREHDYQRALAKAVLAVLLEHRVISIDPSRLSDRIIKRCLDTNLNFTRDGSIPTHPPTWLVDEVRYEVAHILSKERTQ